MLKPALLAISAVILIGSLVPAHAQDDTARKEQLVNKMHEIRPARTQVEEAIEQVSRNLPPVDRDRFLRMVNKAFDYDKLEKMSKESMMELFTVAEMEKMVDYFGSPEAKAIGEKLPKYQEKLQPEIIRMLDAAMMADRTGATSTPVPETKKAP
jgi:hypothetical protein